MTESLAPGRSNPVDTIASSLRGVDGAQLIGTLQALADASRQDLTIRHQLAHEDILKALIDQLEADTSITDDVELQQQILRCIGNACASDPDAVRTVCNIGLRWMQPYVTQDPSDLPGVLRDAIGGIAYNLMAADVITEGDKTEAVNPATKACFDIGMHDWVIRLLASKIDMRLSPDELVDMLFWLSSFTADDTALSDLSTSKILSDICPAAPSWSAETIGTWVEAIVALLRPQATKAILAARYDISPLYELLGAIEDLTSTLKASSTSEDAEEISFLTPQASNLTWLLSDISSEPVFAKGSRLESPLLQSCIEALQTPTPSNQVFIASTLIVGNAVLNVEEDQTARLIRVGVAESATRRLSSDDASSDLLFAGAGLLSNLCRPKSSREVLGATPGLLGLIERLCKSDTPQLSQAGLRLVRSLGRECPVNQARLAPILEALPQPAQQPAIA